MKVPLLDLKRQYQSIKAEADKAACDVLSGAAYIMGENVKKFEEEFAQYIGVKHAISVGNGTDSLVIALKAMGIGAGDEVITTPYTFFATGEAISFVGATPVFVDVRKDTFNIDPSLIEAAITEKTKAILPVHIFGLPADMAEINAIAKKHGLLVLEDACQAAGAKYDGKMAGALADAACFSFFPTKNLGCMGDGGMIVTDNDDIALICRALRLHGSGENGREAFVLLGGKADALEQNSGADNTVYNPLKYYNYLIGHNSRLDEIQAALLRIKLRRLDEYVAARREHAAYYTNELAGTEFVTPGDSGRAVHAYHQYIILSENRAEVTGRLAEAGIGTGIYYPVPVHLQMAYTGLGYKKGSLPVAEYLSERTFALPMFPELEKQEQDYVIGALKNVR